MRNLEIVQNYLDGDRPYLTVTGHSGEGNLKVERKIGDVWTDSSGYTYEQKNGYIFKSTRMGNLVRESLGVKKCECCGSNIAWSTSKLDEKFYNLTNQCFDCIVEYETELRFAGKYKDYETKKILLNQKAYLEDIISQLEESNRYLETEKVITFVNQTGLVEEWPNVVRKKTQKAVKKDLKKAKEYLIKANELLKSLEHVQLKRPTTS